jgi:quaternary ammonium compound-resistance protein SugE
LVLFEMEGSMAWVLVLVAGLLEVAFAICLKASKGFSEPLPTVGFIVAGAGSFWLLSLALKNIQIGVAYAVWTGIGAAGTAVIGMLLLGEARDIPKVLSLVLLLSGIIGLRLSSAG